MHRRPPRSLQQWRAFSEVHEQAFLNFMDSPAYCYSTTDCAPDESEDWETLYAICDRRFLPTDLTQTTFA